MKKNMYRYMIMAIALSGFTAATIDVASAAIIPRIYSPPIKNSAWYKRKQRTHPAHQITNFHSRRSLRSKNDFANLNR